MAAAYAINDKVRYGQNGICVISGMKTMEAPGSRRQTEYYVLKPVSNPVTTLYVPADSETLAARMQRVLSREETDKLILSCGESKVSWPEDRKARAEYFRGVLKTCDQSELLSLVSCIYLKRRELTLAGRKLSATDDGILKQAERMIESDFAYVLGIPENEVGAYIRRLLGIAGS